MRCTSNLNEMYPAKFLGINLFFATLTETFEKQACRINFYLQTRKDFLPCDIRSRNNGSGPVRYFVSVLFASRTVHVLILKFMRCTSNLNEMYPAKFLGINLFFATLTKTFEKQACRIN